MVRSVSGRAYKERPAPSLRTPLTMPPTEYAPSRVPTRISHFTGLLAKVSVPVAQELTAFTAD